MDKEDRNKYIVVGVLAVGAASVMGYLWWKKQQDDAAAAAAAAAALNKADKSDVKITYTSGGGATISVTDTSKTCPTIPCDSGYECNNNRCIPIVETAPATPSTTCTDLFYAVLHPVECAQKAAQAATTATGGETCTNPVYALLHPTDCAYQAGQQVGQIITDVNNKAVLDHNNAVNTTYNKLLHGEWGGGISVCTEQADKWAQLHGPLSMSTSMPTDSDIKNMIVQCPSGEAMLLMKHRSALNDEYNRLTSSTMPGGTICVDQARNWLLERWSDYNRKTTATAAEISTMRIACTPIVGPAAAVVPGLVTWFTGLFG